MGIALHLYVDANGGHFMPVSIYNYLVDPPAPISYWFGMQLDANPAPYTAINVWQGYLIPFMENNAAVQRCPDFSPPRFTLRFNGATSGYGYNYVYLGPGINPDYTSTNPYQLMTPVTYRLKDVVTTSRTIAFADSAHVREFGAGAPALEENAYLEAPSAQYPTVHFRHQSVANVFFIDGHVEQMTPTINPPSPWATPDGNLLRQKEELFDIGTTDALFNRQ
jgi:prepilin-type processing-associated H-X9-DG protein